MKYLFLFSFLTLFFYSCECNHEGYGYVYDQTTKSPVVNARVEIAAAVPGKDTMSPPVFTDENGYFKYQHNSCKDMVSIYKPNYIGYTTKDITGDTIYLEFSLGN